MKKIYMLSALLCASVFSFTSCIEETFENPVPANDGDEIIFGARAGFEGGGAATKTIYSGEIYELNGKKFERIDWLDEQDAIQIYCPQAEGPNPSHYTVYHAKDHDTQKDYAYLAKNGDSALQWNGDGEHHFYAMYPSSSIFTSDQSTLASGIKMDGTVLKGTVPGAQTPISIEQEGSNWIAKPNMKFAYMAARSTATREESGKVSLTFVPIVTAVQIQLTLAKGSIDPVSIAEIQVQGNGIAGDFSADLSETAWTGTYPTCVNEGAGTGIVQVSMWKDSNPITLEAGQSLTFTVFLRPGAEYSNLKVSYSPTGSGYLGKTMGSATDPVVIKKNIKTVITGFNLPARFDEEEEQITVDASKWMTQVADEIDFKKLSIPGTGGSFSYNYTADTDGYFRSQHTHMTIPEQWKVGIRAFEIVSDRIEKNGDGIFGFWNKVPASLAGTPVTCNKNSVGINVGAAMEQINNQLNANPQECAVVIFTYQPEGNSPDRNATKYAQSLKLWFDGISYKDKFVLYRPDITLGEVRGKILVIVRLNQSGEKDGGSFSDAVSQLPVATYPFLLVDGCGTAKDKWGARGYTINGTPAPNISNSASTYIEQYMQSATIDPTNHSNVARGSMNFAYKTNTAAYCWYHEWARVLPNAVNIEAGRWGSYNVDYPAMYWFESYSEKLSNAVETFKMAISDQFTNYVFVNTLSGYMATDATKGSPTYSLVPSVGSAYGGDGGDIDALATRLNSDFYREVLSAGMEQTTGPTGIVMMDYVTNTPTEGVDYDGSYYLPGVIIANNFKHGSGNGSNTGGGNQGNQGNQGEGDNDTPGDEGDGF